METLQAALQSLARGSLEDIAAFFQVIETDVTVNGTSAKCHIHCIALDGNSRPRVEALVKHLVHHLLDYSIPRKRISEAIKHQEETGSTQKIVSLALEAKALFSKLAKSGEGGELILFLMAERFLKLPQMVCKMSLKTNTEMHFHGADGLHAGVDLENKKLCLYWGESKLHSDITSAVYSCMKSLAPILLGTGGVGSSEERDLQVLGQYLNVDNSDLEESLKRYLDPESAQFNSVEFRGICFVGFDYDKYPADVNTVNLNALCKTIEMEIDAWQGVLSKRITEEKINPFVIHCFLAPFPAVEEFRSHFKAALDN